ncbi:MAG TPA: hypothetical protein P5250_01600 [Bacteroidales bacterium]|nr:hypothetical protein [Bacteroidales bacterium]
MKFFLITSTIILFTIYYTFAQNGVAINTTGAAPDPSAMLDVSSSNKGFLPPRVALVSTTNYAPLVAHVEGMIVYNTATVNDVTPGLYVNDGTKWLPLKPEIYTAGTGIDITNNVISSTNTGTVTNIVNYTPSITGYVLNYNNNYYGTGSYSGMTGSYVETGDLITLKFSVNINHMPYLSECTNQYKYIEVSLPFNAYNANSIVAYGGGFTTNNSSWGTISNAYVPSLPTLSTLRIAAPGNGNLLQYNNCSNDGSWTFSPWITYKKQ